MRHDRIKIDPDVMLGKACIADTRITVEQLLRKLASGMSVDDIAEAHPHITALDVQAAQAYAADILRQVWTTTRSAGFQLGRI